MRKKRILCPTEASFLSTGYSYYTSNVLSHLHNTGKFEVAELACYCSPNDPRQSQIPWKIYPNAPQEGNQAEKQIYDSSAINQFGEWKFESACLDFQPDIVFDVRDHWMLSFEETSPYRRMYNLAIMPTVDSSPQAEDWISTFINADGVFTYNDWSLKVLEEEGGGLIKTLGSAPPGVDLNLFKPVLNKKNHKAAFGINENTYVIGTVMRNQKRKLYPDLFEAFATYLNRCEEELANKTILYVHASYPDLGWDFPRLLKKLGISHKVLFTYVCFQCGLVFPRCYSDVRTTCPKCHHANCTFPNTQKGIDRQSLTYIYNTFDVFIQYAICEGFGIPQIEATACGVPIMSVDYSAMADVVRKTKGYPIKVQRMFCESETGCYRALPDNEDLVQKLLTFFQMPESLRARKGNEARLATEKHYNWPQTCKKWENYFDSVEIRPVEQTWASQPHLVSPTNKIPSPQEMSDEHFVNWAIVNVLGKPELIGSFFAMRVYRDLMWGAQHDQMGGIVFNDLSTLGVKTQYRDYNRESIMKQFTILANFNNRWEQARWQKALSGQTSGIGGR